MCRQSWMTTSRGAEKNPEEHLELGRGLISGNNYVPEADEELEDPEGLEELGEELTTAGSTYLLETNDELEDVTLNPMVVSMTIIDSP